MPQIWFAADTEALVGLMERVGEGFDFRYVPGGPWPTPDPFSYASAREYLEDASPIEGTRRRGSVVLVPANAPPWLRSVRGKNGGLRYSEAPGERWLLLYAGGTEDDQEFAPGYLMIYDDHPEVAKCAGRARRYFKKHWTNVGGWWVSPDLETRRRNGLRIGRGRHAVMTNEERYRLYGGLLGSADAEKEGFAAWMREYEGRSLIEGPS